MADKPPFAPYPVARLAGRLPACLKMHGGNHSNKQSANRGGEDMIVGIDPGATHGLIHIEREGFVLGGDWLP